jgi:hypothetical protein
VKNFYATLYSSKLSKIQTNLMDTFFIPQDVKLSDEVRDFCEQELTKKECLLALKAMPNEKSRVYV